MKPALFHGPLKRFGQTLLPADDPRQMLSVPELLRPETLDRLLMRVYGPGLMPSQLPVLVSQWSKYYFMQLIPPVVVAMLVHDWQWSLGLDHAAFALDDRGVLDGVRFADEDGLAADTSGDPFQRFGPLLEHLQRVIEALSVYGNVAPGVLWGNVGDYLETCLTDLARVSDAALTDGYALLNERTWPDGSRNLLFNAITYRATPEGKCRQRRSCCLSYRVEWVGRCGHCPLGADET